MLVAAVFAFAAGCSSGGADDAAANAATPQARSGLEGRAAAQVSAASFTHRGLVGWINDFRRDRLPAPAWPNVTIDDTTVADITEQLDFMQRAGMNQIVIWGLFTAEGWAPDVASTVDAARRAAVTDLISRAHARGIKVLAGLGVYSWGFKRIIAADPSVRCASNADVMNPAAPQAWQYQKAVLDYIFDNYPLDGMSVQSADKGRCRDDPAPTDVAYHATLVDKAAAYVKAKNPALIVGVANWGLDMSQPADQADWVRMTRHVDYLAEAGGRLAGVRGYRKQLAAAIAPCALGGLGSPFVEPIEHLETSRYFVPTFAHAAAELKALYEDGGRAVETYTRRRGNAADLITLEATARLERDINANTDQVLADTVSEMYGATDASTVASLVGAHGAAESAFFTNATGDFDIVLSPRERTSTAVSDLLWARLSQDGRSALASALDAPLAELQRLSAASTVGNKALLASATESLRAQLNDIRSLGVNTSAGNGACSLVSTSTVPAVADATDGVGYELGTRVQVTANSLATRIRFWKAPSESGGAHAGALWDAAGNKLAVVTLPAAGGGGWVEAALPNAVALRPGADYIVSVTVQSHFATAPLLAGQSLTCPTGRLIAPASTGSALNGVFGVAGAFPTQSYRGNFYFVDLLVE
jgi:Domain of unknown function (DUF4082)